ncbi:MAG: chemotaxis protein CheX [Lachnospiraceae bacterium]|nr:chemotaxis protein CheX [Lachnospiraceae bacterium]
MAAINANHINPFLMASSSVLRDCCMLSDLEIGKPYLRDTSFSADDWVIMIGLTGELKGQVLIAFTTEAVLDVASRMCMTTIQQMDEMSSSAICELGNMILGNAATILAANEIGIDITPPTLSHGMVEFRSSLTKNLCIPLTFDAGKKIININLSIVG